MTESLNKEVCRKCNSCHTGLNSPVSWIQGRKWIQEEELWKYRVDSTKEDEKEFEDKWNKNLITCREIPGYGLAPIGINNPKLFKNCPNALDHIVANRADEVESSHQSGWEWQLNQDKSR